MQTNSSRKSYLEHLILAFLFLFISPPHYHLGWLYYFQDDALAHQSCTKEISSRCRGRERENGEPSSGNGGEDRPRMCPHGATSSGPPAPGRGWAEQPAPATSRCPILLSPAGAALPGAAPSCRLPTQTWLLQNISSCHEGLFWDGKSTPPSPMAVGRTEMILSQ